MMGIDRGNEVCVEVATRLFVPLKHLRYPGGVTIGIAAHAMLEREERIVVCTDWLVGDGFSSVEHSDKVDWGFPGNFVALWSGGIEDVQDLLRFCRGRLNNQDISRDDLKGALNRARKDLLSSIRKRDRKETNVTIVVAGFAIDGAIIALVDQNAVYEVMEFCAIGSGNLFADPWLRWRYKVELDPTSNIHEVLYRVYEAKRFSETCDTVGERTTFLTLEKRPHGIGFNNISSYGLEFLDSEFQKHGPQALLQQRDQIRNFPDAV